ncbi:MAG: cytochrome c biogenesis protein CcdA [Candidatus Heimdallarchaeota archaeon]|nr:MAG: cytochrome c biogenesis protein CcdA [Candidatus Heimdallarchaeota archaeon]
MLIFGIEVDESVGLPLFFLVGLYVALSPCLFPIMPLTVFRIMSKSFTDDTSQEQFPTRRLVLQWVILLTAGILITFFLAILISSYVWSNLGSFLIDNYREITFLLGIFLIIMGIFLLFPILEEKTFARIPIPQQITNSFQRDEYRNLDLFIIGFGYSFIALPCSLPVFLVLLTVIPFIGGTPLHLVFGMALFSIGLLIPYLILVFVTAEARTRAASFLAEKFRFIEVITGVLIIIFGLLFVWPSFGGPYVFSLV